jgi:hypothetical protein
MSNYSIKKVELEDKILTFWEQSPYATIFTHPLVLPKLVPTVEWWMAYSGTTELCLWPICGNDFRNGGVSKFAYYVGPFWGRIKTEIPMHRWLEMSRKVYRGYMDLFISEGLIFESSLSPLLTDVREFIWMNKDLNSSNQIEITPKYTAIVKNINNKSVEDILGEMKKVRRQDIKSIMNNPNLFVSNECNTDELYEIYRTHFEKRGFIVPSIEYDKLNNLIILVNQGFGFVVSLREKDTNRLVSLELILYGNNVANAITNLTIDDYRDTGAGTTVIYLAMIKAREMGLGSFDFNGANSDSGAFFKHSMGAEPALYFDIKLLSKVNP